MYIYISPYIIYSIFFLIYLCFTSESTSFMYLFGLIIYYFKGTQKGKVTCYARERVNKNKLF